MILNCINYIINNIKMLSKIITKFKRDTFNELENYENEYGTYDLFDFIELDDTTSLINIIRKKHISIDELPELYRNNKDIVLEILLYKPDDIIKLNEDLQNDSEVIYVSFSVLFIPLDIKKTKIRTESFNKLLILRILKNNKNILGLVKNMIPNIYLNDIDIASYLIKRKDINSFSLLSSELRNDLDFAIHALSINPINIAYCGYSIRNDKNIALDIVKLCGSLIIYLTDSLKNDEDVIYESNKPDLYIYTSKSHMYNNKYYDILYSNKIISSYKFNILDITIDSIKNIDRFLKK